MADYLNIAGRVRTTASDGVAMEAQEVKDLNLNKSQQEVNADVQTELGDRYTKEETYSKEQLNELITTPDVNHVSVVATDATTAVTDILPATGEANTIYRVGNWDGTQYDPTMYALYAWNGSAYVCLAVRSFVGEVYDISVNHPDGQGNPTPYADLTAALGTNGANIPQSLQRGGMSVKFVQSIDNKYVRYNLIADEFTTDVTKWAIDDVGVYVENPEFIYVKTDKDDRILWAIKTDGTIYYGAGVPQQIIDYIEEKIEELSLDEYEDIVAFLNGLEEGDKTLQTLLNEKVDKEDGKSLIDEEYASTKSTIDNPEFLEVTLDTEDKILEGIQQDGTKVIGGDFKVLGNMEVSGVSYKVIENPEYLAAWVDAEDKVVFGFKADGKTYVGDADFLDDIESVKAFLANFNDKNIDWDALTSIIATENPEYIEATTDSEGKLLAGRTPDGAAFENVGFTTPKVSINGATIENIQDHEGRTEIKTDAEGKILSYRDSEGVMHEEVGIESYTINTRCLNMSEEGLKLFQSELETVSPANIRKYNLPNYGIVNIESETFYLEKTDGVASLSDVYVNQVIEDTEANANKRLTICRFFKNNTSTWVMNFASSDVKLVNGTYYASTKVSKINNICYYYNTLGTTSDGSIRNIVINNYSVEAEYDANLQEGETKEIDIEVIQVIGIPDVRTWFVDKKVEHNCLVNIDFGNYLQESNIPIGIKFQGSSTTGHIKRNFRTTFYKDTFYSSKKKNKRKVKIGEMVRCSGFNLKANFTNYERVKEQVMNNLFIDIWNRRDILNRYPWDLKINPYTGATGMIKGFPIRVNIGEEFYGVYIFGLKKDEANYCLDGDDTGMLVGGTLNTINCWTAAKWYDWEDEINDAMSESNKEALTNFFDFINSRLYVAGNGDEYLSSQVTLIESSYYVTSTLVPGTESVTATRTSDAAYEGSDGNLYILSELTDINGVLYVTSSLIDGQPTIDSVIATEISGGHNIYLGSDGERYLSKDITTINNVKYVTSKIVWDTEKATAVELIPFNRDTISNRMSVVDWIDYIICLQVFLMRDNTCRNLMLYTDKTKRKFYPFIYDLDLDWNFTTTDYNVDIMVPNDGQHENWGSYAGDMSLWENFKNEYWDEICNRYFELRNSVINIKYIETVCNNILANIPDSDKSLENQKWWGTFDMKPRIQAMEERLKWLDTYYVLQK